MNKTQLTQAIQKYLSRVKVAHVDSDEEAILLRQTIKADHMIALTAKQYLTLTSVLFPAEEEAEHPDTTPDRKELLYSLLLACLEER